MTVAATPFRLALTLCAFALAACSGSSSNVERPPTPIDGARGFVEGLAARRAVAQATPGASLTPENLRAAGISGDALGLIWEERGLDTALTPAVVSGRTVTWETAERLTVSTRTGVLSATRGLGQDVLDAATAPLEAALAAGRPADYVRGMTILDGGNAPYPVIMRCALRPGDATGDLGVPARVWVETCRLSRPDGSEIRPAQVRNTFVFGAGTALLSRQWVGPRTGMLTLRRFQI